MISFYFFNYLYIYSYVYTLFGPSLPPAPTPLNSRQNLFCPLVLQFCWGENIAFLLVWDKDSYAERFLALLACTCVLQPILVHLCQISPLLPGPFPIVASANLRLLYSLLYSEHIKHFQVLGFLSFPSSSRACSPLSVWPMSNNITAFF
jgi:hypothetical protein